MCHCQYESLSCQVLETHFATEESNLEHAKILIFALHVEYPKITRKIINYNEHINLFEYSQVAPEKTNFLFGLLPPLHLLVPLPITYIYTIHQTETTRDMYVIYFPITTFVFVFLCI
jgi:hypothetical protein